MEKLELVDSDWKTWLIVAPILISQSTWLFIDARKRGSKYWFWGFWGLIQFPLPLLFYWIFVRRRKK